MVWSQIHATSLHLSFLCLSGSIILYTVLSRFLKETLLLAEPPLATLVGMLAGPAISGIVEPQSWRLGDHVTKELARLTTSMQVFIVGVGLPAGYCKKHWKGIGILLGPVMIGGWIVCATLIHLIFGASYPTALVISACLTPTDPVLVATILEDPKATSVRIKHLLAAESGVNDGTSYPFLFLGVFMLKERSVGAVIRKYLAVTIAYQCMASIVIGLTLGYGANRLLRYSYERERITENFVALFPLALIFFSLGFSSTLGMDDFLLVFSAGIGYAYHGRLEDAYQINPVATSFISFSLSIATFIYFGVMIPWAAVTHTPKLSPLKVGIFVVLVLLLRRLPFVIALKRLNPDIKTYKEALFCGHFGPMGVGALFLSMDARDNLKTHCVLRTAQLSNHWDKYVCEAVELVWPLVCFTVLGSVVVHGLSMSIAKLARTVVRTQRQRVKPSSVSVASSASSEVTNSGSYHDEESLL
ncbi:Cation/H+ exchanger [Aspergillus leporis]|jgi:NhaP-type Na+/H+ or K+/H+ antiporter|uniref:Cation/H+ exchanger n=1 Tax=Aspergillus leporis TaxID=41062 RepID=A0A5N5WJY2_9EURO|nr:Cation/H+ exchanger [Aspergillus leporis]